MAAVHMITCIHAFMHIYIYTCVHTCYTLDTYMHAIHAIHTCKNVYIHTRKHAYIHTKLHTYIDT